MAGKPFPLTVVSGGINRLRTKGGADRNNLYELLNGYVTQANTVKVRPGTTRNADISAYSGAGTTKGLVSYQGQKHVFSHEVVSVPPNYALHVLGHPAAQQSQYAGTLTMVSTVITSTPPSQPFPFAGTWETDGNGYSNAAFTDIWANMGAASVTNIGGNTLIAAGAVTGPGGGYGSALPEPNVIVVLNGVLPQTILDHVIITPAGGVPLTLYGSDALFNGVNGNIGEGQTWAWAVNNAADYFPASGQSTVQFYVYTGGVNPGTLSAYVPIPLKEIHFAAQFLGGLYVVAEFDTTRAVNAQYGSVFHYWIQSSTLKDTSNVWSAGTDYQIGDVVIPTTPNGLTYIASRRYPANPLWTASTLEAVNNIVEPNVPNGFKYTCTVVTGANPSTGTSEPTWPTTDGATVQEFSSIANDQTILPASAAPAQPLSTVPTRYKGIA